MFASYKSNYIVASLLFFVIRMAAPRDYLKDQIYSNMILVQTVSIIIKPHHRNSNNVVFAPSGHYN